MATPTTPTQESRLERKCLEPCPVDAKPTTPGRAETEGGLQGRFPAELSLVQGVALNHRSDEVLVQAVLVEAFQIEAGVGGKAADQLHMHRPLQQFSRHARENVNANVPSLNTGADSGPV